jgi:hypothetical protein
VVPFILDRESAFYNWLLYMGVDVYRLDYYTANLYLYEYELWGRYSR